jgi:hypothetical protein
VKEAVAAAKGPPTGARASGRGDKESRSKADVARRIVVKPVSAPSAPCPGLVALVRHFLALLVLLCYDAFMF